MKLKELYPEVSVTLFDFSIAAVEAAKSRGLNAMLANLQFPMNAVALGSDFDLVIAAGLLEFIQDEHGVIETMRRLLCKDGVAIVSVESKPACTVRVEWAEYTPEILLPVLLRYGLQPRRLLVDSGTITVSAGLRAGNGVSSRSLHS